MIGIVLGGRLGYVLFYNFPYYVGQPARNHRAVGWRHELPWRPRRHHDRHGAVHPRARAAAILSSLDLLGAIGTIGIFLGRIANFINGELYGAPTTLPWGVVFPTDPEHLPRHPSQLYEAVLEGLAAVPRHLHRHPCVRLR